MNSGLMGGNLVGVGFQHAGLFTPASVTIHPEYSIRSGGDIAVIKLAQPVNGVAPSQVNNVRTPLAGTVGTIVGFGRSGGDPSIINDSGVKRVGGIRTTDCWGLFANTPHVCWDFTSFSASNTCHGDSGGPLFVNVGGGDLLAGVTSGAFPSSDTCSPPTLNLDTDVFRYRSWIMSQAGDDFSATCGDLPLVGAPGTTVRFASDELVPFSSLEHRYTFQIPTGTRLLRLALNGTD